MHQFNECFFAKNENVSLTVVFQQETTPHKYEKSQIIQLVDQFPGKIHLVLQNSTFNRGLALNFGVKHLKSISNHDHLLFFIDVDMSFSSCDDILSTIRLNTRRSRQLFFPVVFSQFNPKISKLHKNSVYNEMSAVHPIFHHQNGYFRHFGFGMLALYISDFETLGGFDAKIQGWGLEDVRFVENAILKHQHQNLEIFRSQMPQLVHEYHEMSCDGLRGDLKKLNMCLNSRMVGMASSCSLYDFLVAKNVFTRNPRSRLVPLRKSG